MASEQEKSDFFYNVALPMLGAFAQFALQIETFLSSYEEIQGNPYLQLEDNYGLPNGENPYPDDETVIYTIEGKDVTGKNLNEAYNFLNASQITKLTDIMEFINNFTSTE